ncbi:hypothetical protein [Acinetobacter sp. ASP199]|uniref:hypothetical protein n=1 Tax=unclassified Acinetobacter TaxID=196816 RepID=UPI001F615B1E|nr:hypothetical protein [Acinetobacter sp. ASP199]UNT60260.1 hypothetical protein IHE35_05505 [Acinetobacter sp. ASP199]
MYLNLNNKKFVNAKNTSNGEVTGETVFNYSQVGERIEATYSGGSIQYGHLLGFMTSKNTFRMAYHHINEMNELRIGECQTEIGRQANGKIQLIEKWQWRNGDCSTGESILIEI